MSPTSQNTTIHDQAYHYFSWQELGEQVFSLAQQVLTHPLASPSATTPASHFDRIVALAKGGLTFARSLSDYLAIKDLSSIQIEFYTGIASTTRTPVITQSLPVTIKDQYILLFDDVIDTGETMALATQYLQYHGARQIVTAALIKKTWTKQPIDYFAQTSDAWVIFPNETRETMSTLIGLWRKKGDSPDTIRHQLLKIGFTQAEVDLFGQLQ